MDLTELLRQQWNAKQFALAQITEKSMLDKGGRPAFSCASARILEKWITNDPDMKHMKEDVHILQSIDDPVLIIGPSGTGKEMIARALHGSRSGAFIAVNCTSLPDTLIESELFGHKKGAFTGAIEDRPGKFEAAFGGTVFLDEIGDMPISMQTKLLRVLQEKCITSVGENIERPIKCKVVCATNRTEKELLDECKFRKDLYYRISTFVLKTKSLSERWNDVEDIVSSMEGGEELIQEFNRLLQLGNYAVDDEKAVKTFFNLDGNVRSLQAQVRRYKMLKRK